MGDMLVSRFTDSSLQCSLHWMDIILFLLQDAQQQNLPGGKAIVFDDHLNDIGHVIGFCLVSVLRGSCTCPPACTSLHGHPFAVNWLSRVAVNWRSRVARGVCHHCNLLAQLLAAP